MSDTPPTCETCGHTDWRNPIPVVVILQPVLDMDHKRRGLAIARRAIEPALGQWALFAGHVNEGERLEAAVSREWTEETGLVLNHNHLLYIDSYTTPGNQLLVGFENTNSLTLAEYAKARLCRENSEFGILWKAGDVDKLCFPYHRQLAADWFGGW